MIQMDKMRGGVDYKVLPWGRGNVPNDHCKGVHCRGSRSPHWRLWTRTSRTRTRQYGDCVPPDRPRQLSNRSPGTQRRAGELRDELDETRCVALDDGALARGDLFL